MEERLTAKSSEPTHDHSNLQPRPSPANYEPIFRPRPFPSRIRSIQATPQQPLAIQAETYIVQIPKEQIFSIPPPENAVIAERYRNPKYEEKSPRPNRLLWAIIIILIVFVLIICLILGILRILYHPEAPEFSILQVHGKSRNKQFRYQTKLKVKNKNERMENIYKSNGNVILLYNGSKIGTGKFPDLVQTAGSLTNFGFTISSIKQEALAKDIQKSTEDKKGKRHVALILTMNVPVKMKWWNKVIDVVCNFKVSSLGASGDNVISQQCQTKFK